MVASFLLAIVVPVVQPKTLPPLQVEGLPACPEAGAALTAAEPTEEFESKFRLVAKGREASSEFGEKSAPAKADRKTLGASLMWESANANDDVPFSAPWAEKFAESGAAVNGEWNWEYGLNRDMINEAEEIIADITSNRTMGREVSL